MQRPDERILLQTTYTVNKRRQLESMTCFSALRPELTKTYDWLYDGIGQLTLESNELDRGTDPGLEYDTSGRLVRDDASCQYTFDNQDRLLSVLTPDGALTQTKHHGDSSLAADPIRYVDPSGNSVASVIGTIVDSIVGAVASAVISGAATVGMVAISTSSEAIIVSVLAGNVAASLVSEGFEGAFGEEFDYDWGGSTGVDLLFEHDGLFDHKFFVGFATGAIAVLLIGRAIARRAARSVRPTEEGVSGSANAKAGLDLEK
nr:uncharacterized protein CTRU02_13247 [Colletotrichum truncatum]KAF6783739.1 hypothetical protein CTRU02_13247 [Colletotrichum truncatum]